MKKPWCKHIKVKQSDEFDKRFRWQFIYNKNYLIPVPRNWKLCPVCQSERPTKANIEAANL